jgi:hypothetical protein
MPLGRRLVRLAAVATAIVGPGASGFAGDPAIRADNCGIAAGRDATGNVVTCNYGLTPDQLKELTRAVVAGATEPLLDRIETLSKRLGISEEATKTLLRIVGEERNVADEDLPKVLSRVAIKYKNLQAQVAAIGSDNSLARAVVLQVQSEITAGRLQNAGELLQQVTRRVATLSGTCVKAEAMGVVIDSANCLPQILNTEYRDDRNAFTFVTQRGDGTIVISFSGNGGDQIHVDRDNVVQPIDKVVFTFQGSSDNLKARGTCSFSNPYKGTPSGISCHATTSTGSFSGEFISDGVPPNQFEAGAGAPVQRSAIAKPQILHGSCGTSSHVAEGRIGEDLSKRQSQFFCDAAVIASFGDDPRHRLIQFTDSQANHARILGFGGLLEDATMLRVNTVYFEIGRPTAATDGACKLFLASDAITAIACGAKIDESGRRTVPVVSFVVDGTAGGTSQK